MLAGLAAQDPYAEVLTGEALTDEPYGIGVNADDVDLVRFINGVLERMRADGSWQASYEKWLKPSLKAAATQPTPVYGDEPDDAPLPSRPARSAPRPSPPRSRPTWARSTTGCARAASSSTSSTPPRSRPSAATRSPPT